MSPLPASPDPRWTVEIPWQTQTSHGLELQTLKMHSEAIPLACQTTPNSFIEFPSVIHGAHILRGDGRVVETFGDPEFKDVRSFYGAPVLQCKQLLGMKVLDWEVVSYTHYFARIPYYPRIVPHKPTGNFFSESMNLIAAGSLMVMAIFCVIIFFGKVSHALTFSLALASIFMSGYFASTVADFLGVQINMFLAHRLADFCVWVGMLLFMNTIRIEGR